MKAYNKFIKKVKKTNIEVSEYRFLDGAGWIKSKDYDNLPNNLKKAYYWELENLNEDKLKQLQSNAVNELSLLNDEQLKKTLKRLDLLNDFERFNEFIKSFYVKVDNNTYNGLDVSDFKILLDQCFYVDVPNNGNISIEFLTELTDQFFFKSSLLDGLKWQIENLLEPQQNEKPKPEKEAPKTFDELFYNIELVQKSIDVLKEIEPPLIDSDYNYIGKLKGIICVWIDELQRQAIVKHYSDRKIFASLIPQKIKRFSIDESMFGKYHTKAEDNYRTDIKTKVSKIKLSQNSQ